MRIAYLSTDPSIAYRGTRGTAVRVAALTEALAREGSEVLLVTAALAPGPPPPPGLTVELLPGPAASASTAARLAAEPGRQAWLTNRLRQFGVDVVFECLALHSSAGSIAAHQLGVPHLVDLNAPLVDAATASHRLYHAAEAERMERDVLAGAALVLAATSPLAAYATARGAPRVDVLPNAADPERFPARSPEATAAPLAVFVASMRAWHGLDTIVDAWGRLGASAPRLIVIGDGPERSTLASAGFEIQRALPHDQLPSLLASANIGIAPYTSGAARYLSPMKVFEYLAAGLAVVAADLPGVTDHFRDDATVLIPPGSAAALADAVSLLVGDGPLRARLGERGRAIVVSRHTWAHRATRVLQLMQDLALAPAPRAAR